MSNNISTSRTQKTGTHATKPWPQTVESIEYKHTAMENGPKSEPSLTHDPFGDLVGSGSSDAAFTPEDAHNRKGNFIIPFGLPGSGKTTFLASLFKYIDESEKFDSRIVIPKRGKVLNYAGQAMLNQWQKIFNAGRFLGATPVGADALRELAYEVTPLRGQKTRLRFNVVEVSGEDLVRIVAKEGGKPRLPDVIATLFKKSSIRTMIVLVIHPNQPDNDLLFNNLFIWLNSNIGHYSRTFSLAVLIANPDLALQHLHKRRPDTQGYTRLSGNILKIYLKEFTPKTHAIYQSWSKKKRAILPFRVGEIETRQENGETYERILRFDPQNAAQFFTWIYRQFTGRKLGPRLISRVIRWLNG
ncbi:MAG: hypothetical protein OXC62_17230 [Aestuariivita sp.]|nr:hypothetical protein [Aestuariivita sp.]